MLEFAVFSVLALGALAPVSPTRSVIEQLGAAGEFDSLQAALLRSGLLGELAGTEGSARAWTLLAPNDAAFEALGSEAFAGLLSNPIVLRSTLAGHLVRGNLAARELVGKSPLTRMVGAPLSAGVAEGRIAFGKNRVLRVDVAATPLRVHEIESILAPTPAMLRAAVAEHIEKAVERGAPLYNEGDQAGCARIYAQTLDEILDVELLDMRRQFAKEIAATHDALEKSGDAEARAWALRRGLDAIWARIRMQMKNDPVTEVVTLMEFADDSQRWLVVNDDVMGGISDSRFRIDDGKALFTGRLSLENNGGFASVRSPQRHLDLGGWRGIELRLKGDGRRYKLGARLSSARMDVRTWRAEFATSGDWETIRIPFDEMALSIMGRRFDSNRLHDPSNVRSLSFLISDKNDREDFRLEIESIGKYR